mmetsp:Transcript_56249/g.99363  ORF Transcript_56249/g.99363 Transcript_56249/m.99363 type:complete len:244 (+) Transcript_56249:668-1399(+)
MLTPLRSPTWTICSLLPPSQQFWTTCRQMRSSQRTTSRCHASRPKAPSTMVDARTSMPVSWSSSPPPTSSSKCLRSCGRANRHALPNKTSSTNGTVAGGTCCPPHTTGASRTFTCAPSSSATRSTSSRSSTSQGASSRGMHARQRPPMQRGWARRLASVKRWPPLRTLYCERHWLIGGQPTITRRPPSTNWLVRKCSSWSTVTIRIKVGASTTCTGLHPRRLKEAGRSLSSPMYTKAIKERSA